MINNEIKIIQLNTGITENSAPNRLRLALKKVGICTTLITMKKDVEDESVVQIPLNTGYRILRKLDYLLSKLEYRKNYNIDEGIPFSFYRVGVNLAKYDFVKKADIIEIHWVCGSFLSVKSIHDIIKLNKPVIMVCHDNWQFTGGCHVRLGCERFTDNCGKCPQLHSTKIHDWSYYLVKKKKKLFQGGRITVVSPSSWMDHNVLRSSVLKDYPHYVIPNALDITLFKKKDKNILRKKYNISEKTIVLAYGAVNSTSTPYKGYKQLLEALEIFEKEYNREKKIEALVFGSEKKETKDDINIKVKYTGYLNQAQMVEIYNCADIYIVPSLEDSFNYTVAESLACETPVVAFSTGGIVDIIDHMKCGYLAEYNNPRSLAEGIIWVLENNENNVLGRAGRKKVQEKYSEEVIGKQFKELYQNLMEKEDGRKFI